MAETIENEIDLTSVDWTTLSPEEFSKLERQIQEKNKFLKSLNKKEERASGTKMISLQSKVYEIPMTLYNRLKAMKSPKKKQDLINKIILEYNPINDL